MSDASGTSWLDTGARRWSTELLAATELEERHMPSLVEGTAVSGTLRRELAERLGLRAAVVVAGGAGDNAAAACGLGAVADGAAFVSLGTSGVLFAANAAYSPNAASAVHTFCHALPRTWHQMGVILSATDSLNWLATLTGTTPDLLTAALGERLAAPSGVTFLPYLGGERTPHNDANVRGVLVGLGHESDRRALAQAVVEGVAFALCDSRDALRATGTTIARLKAVGGGTRSRYWLQVLATALGVPVDVPAAGDFGAAFGAARLGLIAATGADPAAVCTEPAVGFTVEPNAQHAAAFASARERYRELYPAVRGAR
jgi:xylulokinase